MVKYQRGAAVMALFTLMAFGAVGVSSQSAFASSCERTKPLAGAKLTTEFLDSGIELKRYDFPAGAANSTAYQGRFMVAKAAASEATLIPTVTKVGDTSSQKWLAGKFSALVHVNGNYYDFNSLAPENDLGFGGSFFYAVPKTQSIIGMEYLTATSKTGIKDSFSIRSGAAQLEATGLNLRKIATKDLIVFDANYQLSKLPVNSYAIAVTNGTLSQKFKTGTRTVPKSGFVIAAGSSRVASLKSLATGASVTYRTPAGTYTKPKYDSVTPALSVIGRDVSISADAVNYGLTGSSIAATIFDDRWLGSTPNSAVTVLIDANNTITSIKTTRYTSVPITGQRLLKIYTSGLAAQAVNFHVGEVVAINQGWSSTSGSSLSTVLSYHSRLLKAGQVIASCSKAAEEIRPRTAFGWDQKGNLFLATTTMGRAWPDGGYRVSGSTLSQLANWLKSQGVTDAVSVDGGGSTTMYVKRGSVYSREDLPDSDWVRSIPQGIALVNR